MLYPGKMIPSHVCYWNCIKCHGLHRYNKRLKDSDSSILYAKLTTGSPFPTTVGRKRRKTSIAQHFVILVVLYLNLNLRKNEKLYLVVF